MEPLLEALPQTEQAAQPTQDVLQQPSALPQGALPSGKRGLTGTQLKIIAIVTMVIDHFGAIAMIPIIMAMPQSVGAMLSMTLMRCIGRIGFPIFCFLLVQGFLHTHNVKKYALRLAIFAVISEIPFDIAIYGTWFETSHQNVFLTLVLGLLSIWAIDALRGKWWLQLPAVIGCIAVAQLLNTDYAGMGVVTIMLFYLLRERKAAMFCSVGVWLFFGMVLSQLPQALVLLQGYPLPLMLVGILSNGVLEVLGAFSFLFLARYNGQRGAKLPQYLFYAFYPAHLLLLYGLARLLSAVL